MQTLDHVMAVHRAGDLARAEAGYRALLATGVTHPACLNNLGLILLDSARLDEAKACLECAVRLHPAYAEAHNNLGLVHLEFDDLEQAATCHLTALQLNPRYAAACSNLGSALQRMGRLSDSIALHERAVALDPALPAARVNLAHCLFESARLEEAIAAYRQAIALAPDFAEAHEHLGHALLLSGDLAAGWPHYEWRLKRRTTVMRMPAAPRPWPADLKPRAPVLLVAEQGLGDTLQFCRYGLELRARDFEVSLACQAALVPLLRAARLFDQVLDASATASLLHRAVEWSPLLSVPRALGTTLPTIPAQPRYLVAPEPAASRWRAQFKARGGLTVGIAWQGNPVAEKGNLRGRSFRLESLGPLSEVAGVRFVSLQRGAGAEQLAMCSFRDRLVGGHAQTEAVYDFSEMAALIAACDLIVTCDTSVAHLAAALGRPTWIALKRVPDWRWLLERTDSPWYPSVRLFRQSVAGGWRQVFEAMRTELAARVQAGSADAGYGAHRAAT